MKNDLARSRVATLCAAAWLMADALALAQADPSQVTVPFSDPSRQGTVRVSLFNGGITVRPTTGRDVIVRSEMVREANRERSGRAAGLRRLNQPAGLAITEENNVITISHGRVFGGDDVDIQVPTRTHLQLSTVNGDDIVVERIEGDIEVTAVNGEIMLVDVAGSVVAHATNGDLHATLRQATPDKPMAFTSFNGDVDVRLPSGLKANLKLSSYRGEIYTDFDIQIQPRPTPTTQTQGPAGPLPPLPPLPPAPPLPPNATQDQIRERERQMRDLARQARDRARNRVEVDTAIYGSINGGGPEIELRTFNGDIFLRQGK